MHTNTFKVRIVSCNKSTYWYKNLIGHTYEVFETRLYPNSYELVSRLCWIDKTDCVIVKESK